MTDHQWPAGDILAERARTTPERIALEAALDDITWTYAELDTWADAVAASLPGHPEDRIGVLLKSRPAYAAALLGIIRQGATAVPLATRETPDYLEDCLARADVTTILHGAETASMAAECAVDRSISIDEIPIVGDEQPEGRSLAASDEEVCVLFTSGSTGQPKGVRLTLGNLVSSAVASAFRLGVTPDDRWLSCLPMYHMGGLAPILRCTLYGTRLVVQSTFDPETTDTVMREHAVTGVSLVPTMCQRLLDAGWTPPTPLRTVLLGGGPIAPSLVERCTAADIPVCPTYGLTEAASQVATATPDVARAHPDSVGHPMTGTKVTILDESGQPCHSGETGEIVIAGPTVSPGYLEPAATERSFDGEWFHTGDLGRHDESGRLYIEGRRDDRILTGGETVDPQEVTRSLQHLATVADAAVVGLPDDEWGHRIAAAIVPADDSLEPEEVIAGLDGHLASFKRPKTVALCDEIPRTASGTLDRDAVATLLSSAGVSIE